VSALQPLVLAALLAIGVGARPETAQVPTSAAEMGRMTLSSVGDSSMGPLMNAWMQGLHSEHPDIDRGRRWQHVGDAAAMGALMFDIADIAPMSRAPLPGELAPYAHQYAGDMMKAPVLVRVAMHGGKPSYLAFNRRPDSPVPANVEAFVRFALSAKGQDLVRRAGFEPLPAGDVRAELSRVEGYCATLDPALPHYASVRHVKGSISSVGSDGMKSLMERWMRDFRTAEPGVHKGDRWEHLGTLNGFHALMAGQTDLAPMGRELWPDEAAAFASLHGGRVPFEVRVARGGFNTQQRTTAQAVFVNSGNPVGRITMQQLAAAFGRSSPVTRWGQLGLKGDWAARPIKLHIPPRVTPNAMSMQAMALHGDDWSAAAQEASVAETAKAIAADPEALGFGGFEDGGPDIKTVPVVRDEGGAPVEGTADSVSSGRYPLSRYMYIRLERTPGKPLAPAVREFLRYILSREGQEPILYSGYFPLTAKEAREELAKLD
jgi:ABC-type phosphate transport system substrate-binding protein